MTAQPDGVHTIPVPLGWSAEQAWECIRRGVPIPNGLVAWANVRVADGRMVELIEEEGS